VGYYFVAFEEFPITCSTLFLGLTWAVMCIPRFIYSRLWLPKHSLDMSVLCNSQPF
jgi:hypothetical protein